MKLYTMNNEKKMIILLGIQTLLSALFTIIYFNTEFWSIVLERFLYFDFHFILTFGFSFIFMNIFRFIMILLVFIGFIQLIKQQEIKMLKIFKLPIYFFVATLIAWVLSNLFALTTEAFFLSSKRISWQNILSKVLDFALLTLVIIHFYKNKNIFSSTKEKIKTSKVSRFINSTIDGIILLNISIYSSGFFGQGSILDNLLSKENTFILYIVFLRILYYFVLEVVFSQTIGKLHNNNFVTFEGNRVIAILKRTLSRYIPLDAFSFLGDDGWHDSISNTKVMQEKK